LYADGPPSGFVEVEVERDHPRLVCLHDLGDLVEHRPALLDLALLDGVRSDVDERTGHWRPPGSRPSDAVVRQAACAGLLPGRIRALYGNRVLRRAGLSRVHRRHPAP